MGSIGTGPNQIPVAGMLGTMAFQDADSVNISAGIIGDNTVAELTQAASDAREWTAQTVSQSEAEEGTATTRRAWTAQRVFQAVAAWWAASAMKTKLDGIATGATANAADDQLLARANHTGSQEISTVSGLQTALDGKLNTTATAADAGALGGRAAEEFWHAGNFNPVTKQDRSALVTTATNRTLALTDAWNYVRPGTTSAITLTVPPNASVAFAIGTEITVRASGNITLAAASGVTLNAPSGGTLSMTARMTVTLKKVADDVWDVIGQTVPA